MTIEAVDLFAGTGWGVALQRLGIPEHGVEMMPQAVATREANGMHTWLGDVWDVLERADPASPEFASALLIASPPCQTFSMAGAGAGRRALDEVLALIEEGAYLEPELLHEFGERHDPRTALVLTPLTYAIRHRPATIVLEQVPPVLPVWEAIGRVLGMNGYQVATGILNAEQYGVPQTRKRAILIARRGAPAQLPTPTHSAYYPRDPQRLDPGVLPWVSMAEALGWGMTERPYLSIAAGTAAGGTDPAALGGSGARRTLMAERDTPGHWVLQGNQTPSGVPGEYQQRATDLPSPTLTSGSRAARWVLRSNYSNGDSDLRSERPLDAPATTMTGRPGHWAPPGLSAIPKWPHERTATTIVGRFNPDIVRAPGHTPVPGERGHTPGTHSQSSGDVVRVTAEEAAALQSYPPGFRWVGTKTSTFQQIGNAVPPLLAEAVLRAALGVAVAGATD